MKDRKLATRYARALLSSLPDAHVAEKADAFLTVIRETLDESADFRGLMYDPAIPRHVRKSMLRDLAEQHGMPRQIGNFLATVIDHKRATSLASIAEVFHQMREDRMGVVPAEVTTAAPLADDLRDKIHRALEQLTGRQVRLSTTHDPQLIGGAVTRIGSTVHDGSLRAQLAQLRRKMTQE